MLQGKRIAVTGAFGALGVVVMRAVAAAGRALLASPASMPAGRQRNSPGSPCSAASKAGVAKLAEALAEEVKDRGITVNAILPGIIDTPANRAEMPRADFSRWVRPEQVADPIVFLLSARASVIDGALIPILGRA